MGNPRTLFVRRVLHRSRYVVNNDTSFFIHTPHTYVSILKGVFQQIGAPAVALSSLVSLIVFKSFHHELTSVANTLLGNRNSYFLRHLLQMDASYESTWGHICHMFDMAICCTLHVDQIPLVTHFADRDLSHSLVG